MADFIGCVDKEFVDEREGKNGAAKKRDDYLSWDEYFMGIALLSAERSKDPSTQVGACIVDQGNKIVGIGYNGFPRGCSDDVLPWARKSEDVKETKYPYVVHAEVNAIMNTTVMLHNAKMYVALFPCNECAKMIIQAGIKEIVYLSDKYSETDSVKSSKRMFEMAGVKTRKLKPKNKKLEINFEV
jgi:dCMP deaminase